MNNTQINYLPYTATSISVVGRFIFMFLLYKNKSTNSLSLLFCILRECRAFDLMDSRDFSTIKPPWAGDFGTIMKNLNCFVFLHDFEVFIRENDELVHAEHAL